MWAASRTISQMGQGHSSPQGSRNRRRRPQVGVPKLWHPRGHAVVPVAGLYALHILPSLLQWLTLRPLPPCPQAYRELKAYRELALE